MSYETSKGASYAVLYLVLIFFTILAICSTPQIGKYIPTKIQGLCLLKGESKDGSTGNADYFLSARNSASATAVALSFFASGMGGWIVYATTEMGATPALSWLGVIGYSAASGFPAIVISFLGPKVREMTSGDAFSTTDFSRVRYGRFMQVAVAAVSVFYMFIYIVAEMTTISNVYGVMVGNFEDNYTRSISISLGVFTIFYTTIAGLPASIVTDKFQAVIIIALVFMLLASVTSFEENQVSSSEFAKASNLNIEGFVALITLFLAITSAELFNQGTWQRVWAAESIPAMRKGFFVGSVLIFFVMMFFGIMGMIAYAKDPLSYDNLSKYAFLSFFDILEPLSNFWHVMVLILVTALAASSVDSLQNALTCIFSRDLVKFGFNPLLVTRLLVIGINIPAVILSARKYSVINLFLVADLVCATSVFPLFLGLQTEDKLGGFLPAPTELGAFSGCISGIITVIINGYVNGANDKSPFDYFWLRNGGICALCGEKTMISFIITPFVSFIFTYLVSFVDILVRGDRARKPIVTFPFDDDSDAEKEEHDLKLNPEDDENDPIEA